MTFEFQCPECQAVRMAIEQIIGRKVRCPECGELVVIARESKSDTDEWSWDDQHGETKFNVPAEEVRQHLEEERAAEVDDLIDIKEDDTVEISPETEPVANEDDTVDLKTPPAPQQPPQPPPAPPVSNTDTTVDLPAPVVVKPPETKTDEARWKSKQPAPAAPQQEPPDKIEPPPPPISFGRREQSGEESEMDMTPMVDVTFLLLIFFMVTASFTLQKAISSQAQQQDDPSTNVTMEEFEDNNEVVIVHLDEFNTYHVVYGDKEPIQAPSPHELLRQLRIAREGIVIDGRRILPKEMLIMAHGKATHGRVVSAMDAGTDVGMVQIQVVLSEDQDF